MTALKSPAESMQDSLDYLQRTFACSEVAEALKVAMATVGMGDETVKKVALLGQTRVAEAAPKAPSSPRPSTPARAATILETSAGSAASSPKTAEKSPPDPRLLTLRSDLRLIRDNMLFVSPKDPVDSTKPLFVPFEEREGLFPYEIIQFSFRREMSFIKETEVGAYIEKVQTLAKKENRALRKVFNATILAINDKSSDILEEIHKEKPLEEHALFCQKQRALLLKLIRAEGQERGLLDDLNFAEERVAPWYPMEEYFFALQRSRKYDEKATEIPFPNLVTGGVILVQKSRNTWKWEYCELKKFYLEYRLYLLQNFGYLRTLVKFAMRVVGLLEPFPDPSIMRVGVKTLEFTPDLDYINRLWKKGELPHLPSSYPKGHFKLPDDLKLLRHPESKKQESKTESKAKA